jgi:hypothetical protein
VKYFLNKKIANRKVGNGWLFENGIGLNETSYEIYNICNEKSTDEEILEKIKKIYIINPDDEKKIETEIINCIEQLIEADLIKSVEE